MANPERAPEGVTTTPFGLMDHFPDATAIFAFEPIPLESVKDSAFVALDANVLLLPYKLDGISLPDVIKVYKPLADTSRLVIPAQAAREFAKHRAAKVAEIALYLRKKASDLGSLSLKKVGALSGQASFEPVEQAFVALEEPAKAAREALNKLADDISVEVGNDPVSIAYRGCFPTSVIEGPVSKEDLENFKGELEARFATKRPPGYKDAEKPDAGAGDLIIWQTLLAEGKRRDASCIFVTADEKADWYTQAGGAFQPRIELVDEYRQATGHTLHVIPLSKLMKLMSAPDASIEIVKRAEIEQWTEASERPGTVIRASTIQNRREWEQLRDDLAETNRAITFTLKKLQEMGADTGNLSLPWERAAVPLRMQLNHLIATKDKQMDTMDHLDEVFRRQLME